MNNRFGTTSDMIIQTVQEKEGCACLAIDEKGLYLTSPAYVDRPLADPKVRVGRWNIPGEPIVILVDFYVHS